MPEEESIPDQPDVGLTEVRFQVSFDNLVVGEHDFSSIFYVKYFSTLWYQKALSHLHCDLTYLKAKRYLQSLLLYLIPE